MTQDYLQDIKEIKSLMQDRARFLSLSGISGILAGIYALVGAFLGYNVATKANSIPYHDLQNGFLSPVLIKLVGIAAGIVILSILSSWFFSHKKAKQRKESLWSPASMKAMVNFGVPLITGGIFILLLIYKGYILLVGPATLIFYGLALYSASRYTVRDVGTLGMIQIGLGLVSMLYPGKGIYFWAFGFGVLHIVYGSIMYFKYDRKETHTS